MPVIVTSIHDPFALSATCRRLNLSAPEAGCLQFGAQETVGWIIRLRGVRYPIVCDTLTGLVAYHPHDNAFAPYRCLAQFIYSYYDVRHRMRQDQQRRPRRVAGLAVA
jgi:hypothetical protein